MAAFGLSLEAPKEALMLHVGLDLSRKHLDVCVLDADGVLAAAVSLVMIIKVGHSGATAVWTE